MGLKALPITQPWAFSLLLIMYDKRDDYQLINFIEESKGMQFLTRGARAPFAKLFGRGN